MCSAPSLTLTLARRCDDCGVDTLEDNDFVAGIDHVEGREPLEVAFCGSLCLGVLSIGLTLHIHVRISTQ